MPKAMKDSGIEWVGQIPEEFTVRRIKNCITGRFGGCWGEDEREDNSHLCIRIADFDFNTQTVKMSASTMRSYTSTQLSNGLLQEGDIIVEKSGGGDKTPVGRTVIYSAQSHPHAMFANFCDVIRPSKEVSNRYFAYCLKAFYQNVDMHLYFNQTTGLQNLNMSKWLCAKIPFPSKTTQETIATFLDSKCSEIDSLCADIEKEIEMLEEYKKSVITETVTKGLDKNVEMKDSGIEWIGKIPAHWEVKRVKYVATSLSKGNGITKEEVFEDGDIQCVRYGEIYSKYNRDFDKTFSSTKLLKISSPKAIGYGDILFAGTGELVEEIGKNIVYLGKEPCLAGGDIVIMQHKQNPVFLNYAVGSDYAQKQKSEGKAKLKVVHISSTDIGNIKIAVPPLEEQTEIAKTLNSVCLDIEKAIEDKRTQIELLETYKKSIIYEYVTGKKEVPNE